MGAVDGLARDRSFVGSMFEAVKMSVGSPGVPKDKGLLGALGNGDRGGLPNHQSLLPDDGVPQQHPSGPRASLMEVFNRVSSATAGGVVSSLFPGMLEAPRSWMGGGASGGRGGSHVVHEEGQKGYDSVVSKGGAACRDGGWGQEQHRSTAGFESSNVDRWHCGKPSQNPLDRSLCHKGRWVLSASSTRSCVCTNLADWVSVPRC